MNRLTLIIVLVLCIVVALIGIGYFAIGSKDDETTTDPSTTQAIADDAFVTDAAVEDFGETETEIQEATDVKQDEKAATKPSGETKTQKSSTTVAATTQTTKPTTTKAAMTSKKQEPVSEYEYAYAGFNPSVAVVNSEKWNLLLVNQDYILPEDFTVKTAEVKGGGQSLDYRVVPHYNDMVTAAEADGISLIPVSGYRSRQRQHNNFERKIKYYTDLGYGKAEATRIASEIVLMPGTSEHNAGLAMDFGTNGNYTLDENFAKTDAFKWLSEHAADYGFILRYESDTKHITKITYEPWHWRYVGVKAAKEIKASGVTLEEYLGMA